MKESTTEKNNVTWALKTYGDATKHPLTGRLLVRKMNGMGARSWPDRMFVKDGGRTWYIEYKRPGEGPTPLQEAMITALRRLGHRVYLVDHAGEGRRIIESEMMSLLPSGYADDGSPRRFR